MAEESVTFKRCHELRRECGGPWSSKTMIKLILAVAGALAVIGGTAITNRVTLGNHMEQAKTDSIRVEKCLDKIERKIDRLLIKNGVRLNPGPDREDRESEK